MKQLIIRILFGVIIIFINNILISPNITLFAKYDVDLRVLIPFLALLFLEPFINIFNPFFCNIKNQTLTNVPDELTIKHSIMYSGKEPLHVKIKVHSSLYDIECQKGEYIKERFIPEQTTILLSKERPNEILTFQLKRKEKASKKNANKKATIEYKKGYLTQKIHIK